MRFFLFLILILSFASEVVHAERRVALVIGNSKYKTVSPLANPKNDAQLLKRVLQEANFEVTSIFDAGYDELRKAIIDFGRTLQSADVGLFYYAGHGVQQNGANFLIPIDAKLEHQDYLDIEAVNINQALIRMGNAGNRLNIVILDACRNNPFTAYSRAASRGLAVTQAPSGTYIAYATRPGDVATDGDGNHSPFSAALARSIPLQGLSLEQVFKQVRADVRAETNNRQLPWTSSSITGEFFFHPGRPTQQPKQSLSDAPAWRLVANSNDPKVLQEFIRTYPTSEFAPAARTRVLQLRAKMKADAERMRLALRQPRTSVPEKTKLLRNRFDGDYEGTETTCAAGQVRWRMRVKDLNVNGRVHYRVSRTEEIFAFDGKLSGTMGLLQLSQFKNDRGFNVQGLLREGFDGLCGKVKLTQKELGSLGKFPPPTKRETLVAALGKLQASDIIGTWSNACHRNFSRQLTISKGSVELWNGNSKWQEWDRDEDEYEGKSLIVRLMSGFFSSSKIALARVGQNTVRVVAHDVEVRKEEAYNNQINTVPFFTPGTILDKCR